ncbi:MAG: Abi family protein [Chloroflexota bacterium]|nr:Abi family protein [Chloroflexota bacterium]
MVAKLVDALIIPISATRLGAYRSQGGSDLEMVVNYLWNMELSEALYPCLQTFEIALRNSIHSAFSEHYITELWFDRHNLLEWQKKTLQEARDQLTTYQKPHEAGRIVAELPFGFWSSMFNRPYEQVWYADGAVLLERVFPHLPRTLRTRKQISQRVERIRRLRNRVFHYEPIWNKTDLQE